MLGLSLKRKTQEVLVEAPELDLTPSKSDIRLNTDKEYDALASKIGIVARVNGTQLRSNLLQVLSDNGIQVYNLADVEKYMDSKNQAWGWFPLRRSDIPASGKIWIIPRSTPASNTVFGTSKSDEYTEPIPYPVLLTVEKILNTINSNILYKDKRLIFMVAALDSNPDPFLGCKFVDDPDRTMVVFERWDEPAFRSS